jgi:hypothetical protein
MMAFARSRMALVGGRFELRDFCGSKSCIVMHSTANVSVNAS